MLDGSVAVRYDIFVEPPWVYPRRKFFAPSSRHELPCLYDDLFFAPAAHCSSEENRATAISLVSLLRHR